MTTWCARRLRSVTVGWPVLRVPATGVTGDLEIHNREFRAKALRGTILDGPFEVALQPGPVGRGVTASVLFSGSGRAAGPRLPPFIGLPDSIRMAGTADWRLDGKVERRGDGEQWSTRVEVATRPARPAGRCAAAVREAGGRSASHAGRARGAEPRPHRRTHRIRGGARSAAVRRARRTGAGISSAARHASTRSRWRCPRNRACTSAATGPSSISPNGWHCARRRPASSDCRTGSARWTCTSTAHACSASSSSTSLRDCEPAADAFRVVASGPMADGTVVIPADFAAGRPLSLDMRRLVLQSAPPVPGAGPASPTDPRDLPAIAARAEDFTWQGRHFGRLVATVDRVPQGLRLASLATEAKDFTLGGTGTWLAEGAGFAHAPRARVHEHQPRGRVACARLSRCRGCRAGPRERQPDVDRRPGRGRRSRAWTARCASSSITASCAA